MTVMTTPVVDAGLDAQAGSTTPSQADLIERYEHWAATYFVALFAGRVFDQVLLPEVAAGIDWTGRVRFAPFGRAGRTAAADQLSMWGDQDTRQQEFDRLKLLHRDVHGSSPDGIRFSALAPETWNWILISTMFLYLNSFRAVVKDPLSDDDLQALWEHLLQRFGGMELSDRNQLPRRYADVVALYDATIATKAERTEIFAHVNNQLRRPQAPDSMPTIVRPAFSLVGRVLIRPLATLSIGITDPTVRVLGEHRWTRARQAEYRLYAGAIRIAHERLPRRLTYTPLAYNRFRYQQLVDRYRNVGLESFAPASGCPMGH